MRFADTDGTPIDVYQQNTNINDESGQAEPATINALLDNAIGANGYYGAFGANIHTDYPSRHPLSEAIVASAQARSVPVISVPAAARVDGRPQRLDHRLALLERGHLHVRHDRRGRRQRASDPASHPGPERHAQQPHVRRRPDELHRADDQGRPVRDVHRGQRHLPGAVLLM